MKKIIFFIPSVMILVLAGCGQKAAQQPPAMPPAEVGVVKVQVESLAMTTELPGRMDAFRVAQVRARATGILLKRNFEEGSDVKAGDTLFQIDQAPLEAIYNSTKANLEKAQAVLKQTQVKANRYKQLVEANAISKQDYDDADAIASQAMAEVEAAKAALETAKLNLGYATVIAPISGRIGAAKVTEGALVSQNDATELAVIQQLDSIYFDFTQSSADMLRLRRAVEQGQYQSIAPGEAKVDLILEDGTAYALPGKILFADSTVDPTTGMVTVRAQFPNPEHMLLPGMFARVRLEQAMDNKAMAVLQRGIALGPDGTATAMVIGVDNKVEARIVKISSAIKDKWIVTEGLKEGDMVIVEGLQKARPGSTVKPVAFDPAAIASASANKGS